MIRRTKIIWICTIIFSIAMCFAGCSLNEKSDDSNDSNIATKATDKADESDKTETSNKSGKSNKINIEDIDWNINSGIIDGERYILLGYTNNTKYTIANFEITFKERADITEEEKASFYSDIQKELNASDEDIEYIKQREISIRAEAERVVNPGESVSNINCYYDQGSYEVKNMEHYNLVEPDIATIRYVDENEIYTVYYDYISQNYSTETETETAYQWSSTNLSNKIPKPDVKIVENINNSETAYSFHAYGMSSNQFDSYVEQCKTLGYTVNSSEYGVSYSADNAEGYHIYVYYYDDDYEMSCRIDSPKTTTE